MNIDPGKAVEELGATWRGAPWIVGTQVITIVMFIVLFGWDRVETRSAVLEFVHTIMEKQDQQYAAMRLRLENMSAMVIECYRTRDALPPTGGNKGSWLDPPILNGSPEG